MGLNSVPTAGDEFRVFEDERDDRKLAEERALTFSFSAWTRDLPVGRTLKPMMMASEAAARVTSVSVMPPTAECTMLMRTSDWSILSKASRRASMEPWTSAFTMRARRPGGDPGPELGAHRRR